MARETLSVRKTIVVTGANSGVGLECCKALLARDPRLTLVMAGRSPDRLETEAAVLRRRYPDARVLVEEIDLAGRTSVRDAAGRIRAAHPALDALVCNAGVQFSSGLTFGETGAELTFTVNHLGHFLLTNLLVDHMAADGRIVIVASGTHDPEQRTGMPPPRIRRASEAAYPQTIAEPDGPRLVGPRAYTTSKLCNVLTAYELAHRLEALGRRAPTVNAFDPGLTPGTGLARTYPAPIRAIWSVLLPLLQPLLARLVARGNVNTPSQSGGNLAWLATDPSVTGVTGKYFERHDAATSSDASHDRSLARDLWDLSVELSALSPEDSSLLRTPPAATVTALHG
ncbi:MAG TPA: SDR family NAD(P)-dependent oxidoreductase [Candidatus Binatia bacterium]|jgi:NAD(P)-dependent dehydrogenase (short-subunit alcohol dehydrogenase family)